MQISSPPRAFCLSRCPFGFLPKYRRHAAWRFLRIDCIYLWLTSYSIKKNAIWIKWFSPFFAHCWELGFMHKKIQRVLTPSSCYKKYRYMQSKVSVLKSNNDKESMHIRGKGKTSLVTRVNVDKKKNFKLDGIEFFFNYRWQGFSGEGFYIKPLIVKAENGRPTSNYMDNQTLYFVSKAINEIIHIDL